MGEGAACGHDLEDSTAANVDGGTEDLELNTGAPIGCQIRVAQAEECGLGSVDPVEIEIDGPYKLVNARQYDVRCNCSHGEVVGGECRGEVDGKVWRAGPNLAVNVDVL